MKVDDIKIYDKYMSSYINTENALFKAKAELVCEGESICFELFNDLKADMHTPDKVLMAKINEMFTMVNNYRRCKNNNIEDYIELIESMLVETVKCRKSLSFDNDDFTEYIKESQIVADVLFTTCKNEVDSLTLNENYNMVKSSLNNLQESLLEGFNDFISKLKESFGGKHDKIVERDGKWLKENKDNLLKANYKDIEIEVPSDIKSTFTNLINRHEIFDKNFKNVEGSYEDFYQNIKRFEDKNDNLKNGLDNYIRNGNCRREVSIKKLSGDEVKNAVADMVAYCEEFLSGKGFIENKLTSIMNDYSDIDGSLKESLLYNIPYNDLNRFSIEYLQEANDEESNSGDDLEKIKNKPVENEENKSNDRLKIFRDRRIGITVLMTVAEDRYFDYIELLKGL